VCVVLDDNEVLSHEDKPLQKQLRQLFGARPAELDEKAAMMVAADKEAAEEVAMKRPGCGGEGHGGHRHKGSSCQGG
jgi:hypothetical protein